MPKSKWEAYKKRKEREEYLKKNPIRLINAAGDTSYFPTETAKLDYQKRMKEYLATQEPSTQLGQSIDRIQRQAILPSEQELLGQSLQYPGSTKAITDSAYVAKQLGSDIFGKSYAKRILKAKSDLAAINKRLANKKEWDQKKANENRYQWLLAKLARKEKLTESQQGEFDKLGEYFARWNKREEDPFAVYKETLVYPETGNQTMETALQIKKLEAVNAIKPKVQEEINQRRIQARQLAVEIANKWKEQTPNMPDSIALEFATYVDKYISNGSTVQDALTKAKDEIKLLFGGRNF